MAEVSAAAERTELPVVGDAAPEFALSDTTGLMHTSAEYRGAPLVIVLTRHVH